jgi:hypothetical protein
MKPNRHFVHALASLLLLSSTAALAQGIWRCGTQGNSFSDRPCADGQALTKPTPPNALAVQQAIEVARREAALAQRLRADRLAQDQQFQRAQASLQRTARQASKDHQAAPVSHARTLTGAKASKAGKDKTPATGHAPLRVATAPR